MSSDVNIDKSIKVLCAKQGKKEGDLAKRLGKIQSNFSSWKKRFGKSEKLRIKSEKARNEQLKVCADFFGVTVSEFIDEGK